MTFVDKGASQADRVRKEGPGRHDQRVCTFCHRDTSRTHSGDVQML